MTIIDFHDHFYPPEYLEELQTGHRDVNFRVNVLDKAGVDMHCKSLPSILPDRIMCLPAAIIRIKLKAWGKWFKPLKCWISLPRIKNRF